MLLVLLLLLLLEICISDDHGVGPRAQQQPDDPRPLLLGELRRAPLFAQHVQRAPTAGCMTANRGRHDHVDVGHSHALLEELHHNCQHAAITFSVVARALQRGPTVKPRTKETMAESPRRPIAKPSPHTSRNT